MKTITQHIQKLMVTPKSNIIEDFTMINAYIKKKKQQLHTI